MSYNIDQNMSLMIPRVFPKWVNESKIIRIFEEQQIGIVYKVSIRRTKNEYKKEKKNPIYKAYVYFHYWFNNQIAYNFQKEIFKTKQARVVYDKPWFWVIFENKQKSPSKKDMRIMRIGRDIYRHRYERSVEYEDNERSVEYEDNYAEMETKYTFNDSIPFWSEDSQSLLEETISNILNGDINDISDKEIGQPPMINTHAAIEESVLNDTQNIAEGMVENVLHEEVLHENVLHENVLHENVLHEEVLHEEVLHEEVLDGNNIENEMFSSNSIEEEYLQPPPPPIFYHHQYLPHPMFYHHQYLPHPMFYYHQYLQHPMFYY